MSKKTGKKTSEESSGNTHELETLRNLIYGNQAKAAEKRVINLERRVETIYKELGDSIRSKTQAVAGSSGEKLSQVRQELLTRGDTQTTDLNQRLDALAANFSSQIKTLEENIDAQIKRLHAETTERLLTLQEDTQARDDAIRTELLTLTAWMDDQKASRYSLGDMLVELGEQLRIKRDDAAAENGA
ncbi:MAG: hypothetical protein AAF614_04955 [Chloroflexota bacterium]